LKQTRSLTQSGTKPRIDMGMGIAQGFRALLISLFIFFGCSGPKVKPSLSSFLSGQHVGNGGDPIEQLFENARIDALAILAQLDLDALSIQNPEEYADVIAFLKRDFQNKGPIASLLYSDVAASTYRYIEDRQDPAPGQNTCARTNLPQPEYKETDIRFSLQVCDALLKDSSGTGKRSAIRTARELLLHEASHHFGLTEQSDEALAVRVGVFLVANADAARVSFAPQLRSFPRTQEPEGRMFAFGQITSGALGRDAPNQPDGVTGSRQGLLIWGGCQSKDLPVASACNQFFDNGSFYDQNQKEWLAIPAAGLAGRARGGAGYFANADGFLIWGGCSDTAAACRTNYSDGAFFSLKEWNWRPVSTPSYMEPRSDFVSVTIGEKMLIWGGKEPSQVFGNGALLSAKPNGELDWQEIAKSDEIVPRFDAGHDQLDGRVYVWGGCAETGVFRCRRPLGDGAVFDTKTARWRRLPAPEFQFAPRSKHSVTAIGKFVVVFGGEGENGALSDGAVFDTESSKWIPLDPPSSLKMGLYGHKALPVGNDIVFLGGESQPMNPSSTPLRLRFLDPLSAPQAVWDSFEDSSDVEGFSSLSRIGMVAASLPWKAGADTGPSLQGLIWGGIDSTGSPVSQLMGLEKPLSRRQITRGLQ
jgi:hypothetical protein